MLFLKRLFDPIPPINLPNFNYPLPMRGSKTPEEGRWRSIDLNCALTKRFLLHHTH